MKKRIISLALAGLLLAGSLMSCSTAPEADQISSAITVASSDAETYGEWLTDRLDVIPDDLVIGIGDSDKYGIDMSSFENDGYIIRNIDGKIIIFGKTADGLDRGVRKYANTVDMGEDVVDVTYHEGYRIEELRIFGTDISEYVIEYGNEPNDNMKFAATELQRLVKKACGAELAINETATDAAHKIILRHTTDETLSNDGYRYFAEDGNLVIEGAVKRGCMNGVYRLLQNECGWESLIYGDSDLAEADLVDIPADVNKTETPSLDYIYIHGNFWGPSAYVTDRITPTAAQNSFGEVGQAHHGIDSHKWANVDVNVITSQICYTNDGVYDTILENVIAYIDREIDKGGIPGYSIKCIDISQGDNNRYCFCDSCSRLMEEYGAVSASVVWGANRLAEEINTLYPSEEGIAVQIFAYFRTKIPPSAEMEINENVYITFAQNGNCSNHPMNGTQCEWVKATDDYLVTNENVNHDEWLRQWCEMSDNVYVWYYALDTVLHQYTILDNILADFQYMKELGVKGLFWQIPYHGFGIKRVEQTIGVEVMWNTDMTEEDFEATLCRLLEREYGDGWVYIREYIDLWMEATNRIGCYNCWGYGSNRDPEYDPEYIRQYGDVMLELVEKAVSLAGSAKQEYRVKLFSCHVYYSYIFSHYFTAYENEDTEMLAKLDRMYLDTIDLIKEMGFNISDGIVSVDGGKAKVYPTLEQEAWLVWVGERENHVGTGELRPAPEVEDIYAETTVVAG